MTSTSDRFAIIPVTHGPAPDDAILIGSLDTILEYLPDTHARNDSIRRLDEGLARAAKTDQLQAMARACNVIAFADAVTRLASRLDALVAQREARAQQDAAREAEEEAKQIQAELDALPDPDNPDAHVRGRDQAEFPEPGEPPGTVMPQPTAIEFDGD
jgi:hypothetical protein